jgi:hypothetical protein
MEVLTFIVYFNLNVSLFNILHFDCVNVCMYVCMYDQNILMGLILVSVVGASHMSNGHLSIVAHVGSSHTVLLQRM